MKNEDSAAEPLPPWLIDNLRALDEPAREHISKVIARQLVALANLGLRIGTPDTSSWERLWAESVEDWQLARRHGEGFSVLKMALPEDFAAGLVNAMRYPQYVGPSKEEL